MPVAKLTCPKCEAVLRPATPVPEEKKVKCPKCGHLFVAAEGDPKAAAKRNPKGAGAIQKAPPSAAKKADPSKKPGSPGTAVKKSPPAPAKKSPHDDDEDSGGPTYGVVQEEEREVDDDEMDALEFVPDLSVKDPRGPAQAAVVQPSNYLLFSALFNCIAHIVALLIATWVWIFPDFGLKPSDVFRSTDGKAFTKEYKDLDPQEKEKFEKAMAADFMSRVVEVSIASPLLIYFSVVVVGAVKMQNLESRGFGMAAAIMSMIPLALLWLIDWIMFESTLALFMWILCPLNQVPVGIWSLIVLNDEKVKAGFEAAAKDRI